MLQRNTTINALSISFSPSYPPNLKALQHNKSITHIILYDMPHLIKKPSEELWMETFIKIIDHNYWVTNVVILEFQGRWKEKVEEILNRNRRIINAGNYVQPSSCKLFLCGAGKILHTCWTGRQTVFVIYFTVTIKHELSISIVKFLNNLILHSTVKNFTS